MEVTMSGASQRSLPLTEKVAGSLRRRIGAGEVEPGHYLPSERELCRELGVSRFTVRSALRALEDEGLLERRPSRGYVVHGGEARPGAPAAETGTAVMFLHAHAEEELLGGYHARMWSGARMEAARLGSRIVISSVHGERPTPEKAEGIRRIAAGVMCDSDDEEWVDAVLAAGLRAVRIDHMAVRALAPKLSTVVQDDYGGISLALEHLFERGHRRVGYLDFTRGFEPKRRGHAARRLGAYVGECRRLGLEEDPALVGAVEPGEESLPAAALRVLDAGATALVASHAFLLDGARAAFSERKVAVPGEFGLVVWGEPTDGVDPEGYPTHVAWSKEQMGREAVRRLFAELANPGEPPCTVKVSTSLVDRGTGGCGPAA
jgi:DNA-binding LacI/PurR family transcriptional regulator